MPGLFANAGWAASEAVMQLKEAYLQRVVAEVEDLSDRVAVLKSRIAKQKVSVKLQYHWELDYVRNRFAEFKLRVEELEEASEDHLEEAKESCELAWKDLQHAVDTLLDALP
jgi:hypothetical protein